MRSRHGLALLLAVLAGAATASGAQGDSQESTHPQVHPVYGQASTVFILTFTLRDNAGHEGVMATDYRVQVSPPQGGTSCASPQPPLVDGGRAGEVKEMALPPPAGGWCQGTYSVTVFLQRGPYCPPPQEGAPPTPCPEFATQDLETGSTGFTVGPAGQPALPMVAVPRLKGLKPRTANRRLRRRHLRVRYTGLNNLCAGVPPHGRIILQQPGPGTRVPRGTRVLVQTSCG